MPYSNPTSPVPSPAKETPFTPMTAWLTPQVDHPQHEDFPSFPDGPSLATGPMPGIPRRSSSSRSTPTAVPRRASSHTPSREGSMSMSSSSSTPMNEASSSAGPSSAFGSSGLPNTEHRPSESTLGLKFHPSPEKSPGLSRGNKDSMDSTSTLESSLPSTPADEPASLPLTSTHVDVKDDGREEKENNGGTVPFPPFIPPPSTRHIHIRPPRTSSESPGGPPSTGGPSPPRSRRGTVSHQRGEDSHQASQSISDLTVVASSSKSNFVSSPQPVRPSSMIRKKSGEVVKPSLKVRSQSTPDFTRQAASDEGSPDRDSSRGFGEERSKSVRFAGADDGGHTELESVVLFLREQKVTAVGKAADDGGQPTDTETDNDTELSDFVEFRTRRNAAARAVDEANPNIALESTCRIPRKRVDFFLADVKSVLAGEFVILERVEMQSGLGPLSLKGTVVVRNISFQKWVAVRFTMDHWQTVSEVSAMHVAHIPSLTTGDEGWDRFAFTIKLDDFKRKLDERQMIMCVRFSANGQEWWDANDGINYNFNFKKIAPRRPVRNSTPPNLGGNFGSNLHGLRRNGSPDKVTLISQTFGVTPEAQQATGPKKWTFPKLVASIQDGPSRSESPLPTPPPAVAFQPPKPPDVHSFLSLSKKYCAPSPPQVSPSVSMTQAISSPELMTPDTPSLVMEAMDIMGGNYATLSPPSVDGERHERRSSWNGTNASWDSFAAAIDSADSPSKVSPSKSAIQRPPLQSMNSSSSDTTAVPDRSEEPEEDSSLPTTPLTSSDGESTPLAAGARSPESSLLRLAESSESSGGSSPEQRGVSFRPSTGDLQALLSAPETYTRNKRKGSTTPPSSNSSPPSPKVALPPLQYKENVWRQDKIGALTDGAVHEPVDLTSPSNSTASTGESSPVKSLDSTEGEVTDLGHMLNGHSYQEFLAKFCFYQSPGTVNDDEVTRPGMHSPASGYSSPNGFPLYAQPPSSTPTPTKEGLSADDAFRLVSEQYRGRSRSPMGLPAFAAGAINNSAGATAGGTIKSLSSKTHGRVSAGNTPKASPPTTPGPRQLDGGDWQMLIHANTPPSLTAQ